PVRTIKTERTRLNFLVADTAFRARAARAEQLVAPLWRRIGRGLVVVAGDDEPFAVPQSEVDRFGQAVFDAGPQDDAIDDGLDVVNAPRGQLGHLIQLVHLPVDACA